MYVCFRNDDVNTLTDELKNITDIFIEQDIPIAHAVEPGNVTVETVEWLKLQKNAYPELIEIVQHGWNHTRHGRGEFCGARSFAEQLRDLKTGREILESQFNGGFLPMITFPYGIYKDYTVRAAEESGFSLLSSLYDLRLSRRLFYSMGRGLQKTHVKEKRISYHLNYIPNTRIFEIDASISFIKQYFDDYGDECEMYSVEEIMSQFSKAGKVNPVIVLLLHHRFHKTNESLDLIENVISNLKSNFDVEFASFAHIYEFFKKGQ